MLQVFGNDLPNSGYDIQGVGLLHIQGYLVEYGGMDCDPNLTASGQITLTIDERRANNVEVTICAGENYAFGNLELSEPGTYTETFITENGCDSTSQPNPYCAATIE